MTAVNLTYLLVLLLPPAAVDDRPASAAVLRCAEAGGANDVCLPAPRRGPGAAGLKRSAPPSSPSTFATAAGNAWAAEPRVAPPPALCGPRLLYLLMSLLR
jgi:hypothetical protein